MKIESLQKEFEAFEAECQQDMESKKAAMAQALSKELTDQVEERKRIALEALALEVEEFKTQERLKLLQRECGGGMRVPEGPRRVQRRRRTLG